MALDFPASPVNGQVYDNFIYDSAKGTWKSLSSGASPNYLVNPTITNAVITATAPTPSTVPLTVNGATSQSANLQEWKNSSGIVLADIDAAGKFNFETGANAANIKASSTVNHGYLAFYTENTTPTTRTGYLGFGSNGTSTMTIANEVSAGTISLNSTYVRMPNQPSFLARGCSNTGGGDRTLLFNQTIDFNVGSNYNSSTGRFTAPVAGKYFFEFHAFASAGTRYLATLNKNGNAQQEYTQEQPTAAGTSQGYGSLDGKLVLSLAANDYVEVRATATLLGNSTIFSSFSGYLIG